jgi:signal transduction histidine kinase
LAIVKQLVEPQGGVINVVSKVGKGTLVLDWISKTTAEAELETEILELDKGKTSKF